MWASKGASTSVWYTEDCMTVVRISKGRFDITDVAAAERLLAESEHALQSDAGGIS